jgi:hypothetical protein
MPISIRDKGNGESALPLPARRAQVTRSISTGINGENFRHFDGLRPPSKLKLGSKVD